MHDAKRYNSQANEWKVVKLGNEVDILAGFPFKSSCYTDTTESIKLVRGDNIVQGSFRWDGVKRWPKSMLEGLDSYLLREGDVVLAMDRPWIEAGLKYAAINKHDLPALLVQRTARLRGGANLDTRFLKYVIGSRAFTQHILAMQTGTSVPHISASQIKEFSFRLPPLPTQRAIAHILGTLDDKIECNRNMNRTLEGIVRALFKSWFIDFDPVIDNALAAGNPIPDELAARAALRQQAAEEHAKPLPDDLRALFPAEFTHTDTMGPACAGTAGRWIPKGWEVAPLSRIARLKAKTVNPGNSPDQVWVHFSIPAFDDGRQPVHDKGETIKSGKYLVPPCCVLASKLNPQFPRVWLPDVSDPAVSICSTEFMPFVPKTESELPFLYAFLSSEAAQAEITNRVTGSTGSRQRVKPKEIAEMPVLVPPQALRQRLSLTTSRHLDRLLNNMRSIARLSALRDALLPKLLSGEVTVPVAATLTAEADR